MAKHLKKSSSVKPIWLTVLGVVVLSAIIALLLRGKDIMLLNPKGYIANEQLKLLITATLIMLEIAIPTLFFLYYFAWKYREGNDKATYDPNAGRGRMFSVAIWLFPFITMVLLAVLLVPATHRLEPRKPIDVAGEKLTIQVVALRWKWLFIYPDHNIATVNHAVIPANTPVEFQLTADETPMSSFWIPHLGGMLYAMTGHVNSLNLMGDTVGNFEGSAAEINGAGFAKMRFNTTVNDQGSFDKWVKGTEALCASAATSRPLTIETYQDLLVPTEDAPESAYCSVDPELFGTILKKYSGSHEHEQDAAPAHYEGRH